MPSTRVPRRSLVARRKVLVKADAPLASRLGTGAGEITVRPRRWSLPGHSSRRACSRGQHRCGPWSANTCAPILHQRLADHDRSEVPGALHAVSGIDESCPGVLMGTATDFSSKAPSTRLDWCSAGHSVHHGGRPGPWRRWPASAAPRVPRPHPGRRPRAGRARRERAGDAAYSMTEQRDTATSRWHLNPRSDAAAGARRIQVLAEGLQLEDR